MLNRIFQLKTPTVSRGAYWICFLSGNQNLQYQLFFLKEEKNKDMTVINDKILLWNSKEQFKWLISVFPICLCRFGVWKSNLMAAIKNLWVFINKNRKIVRKILFISERNKLLKCSSFQNVDKSIVWLNFRIVAKARDDLFP